MGCLNVTYSKIGGSIETALAVGDLIAVQWGVPKGMCVQAQPVNGCDVDFSRIREPFSASFGLVCPVGQGKWEFLMCSDKGFLRTFDKGYILVRKG